MSPVEMQAIQGSLILRARGSELLILAHHVSELKNLKQPKDFTRYFMNDALINRPARKLFEAWLRKDGSLWQRLYAKIQKDMEGEDGDTITTKAPVAPKPEKKASAEAPQKAPVKAPAMKADAEDKPAKKDAKETAKKAAVKEPKEEKKAAAAKAKPAVKEKTEKAPATKKVAAAKKTTTAAKKKTTAAAKPSAGKTTKKKK